MPQSKKDLRTQKQKKNVEAGIGDAKGRIASNIKVSSNFRLSAVSNSAILAIVRIPWYTNLVRFFEGRIASNFNVNSNFLLSFFVKRHTKVVLVLCELH